MPEVILPCPAWTCQGELVESKQDGENFFIECTECGMRGPVEPDPYHAQQSWNWLPRALRWTHEPPKVAGDYYHRSRRDGSSAWGLPRVIHLPKGYFEDIRTDENRQWAGPIAPPIEP